MYITFFQRNVQAVENRIVGILAVGEGWHNYHHTFPWDYKTSEIGGNRANWTTKFIDLCERIGWAYDLKTVSDSVIEQRATRCGDGSWEGNKER